MRRYPSPWFLVPVLVGTLVGGGLGWQITTVGCRPDTCSGLAIGMGILFGLISAGGMSVVVVLALRSISEWRDATSRGEDPPGPGCEVPDRSA
ncbi:MAG: hypothetical protein OEO77_05990 [Acidimicrobiia bacterium]|nr:hypothetical protein [Acidimicrobiia bacterium]